MMKKIKILPLVIIEIILLAGAFFLGYVLIGYSTLALALLGIAALVAAYWLIYYYSLKNRKRARVFRIILTILVLIGLTVLIIAEIPIIGAARSDENPEADYVIVLGAGVNGSTPSLTLLNRLYAAKDYLIEYPDSRVVVSGGQGPGEDITEAECMRRWLENAGIAPERIIMEDKSTSTRENLEFSFELIEKNGGDTSGKIAIISNEYHLYRAKSMAAQLGAQPVAVAATTPYPFMRLNYFIREGLAIIAMYIM